MEWLREYDYENTQSISCDSNNVCVLKILYQQYLSRLALLIVLLIKDLLLFNDWDS